MSVRLRDAQKHSISGSLSPPSSHLHIQSRVETASRWEAGLAPVKQAITRPHFTLSPCRLQDGAFCTSRVMFLSFVCLYCRSLSAPLMSASEIVCHLMPGTTMVYHLSRLFIVLLWNVDDSPSAFVVVFAEFEASTCGEAK